jgi:hypothetical protein
MVELNVTLAELVATNTESLIRKYKDIFAWNYIDLKRIPPRIVNIISSSKPLSHLFTKPNME